MVAIFTGFGAGVERGSANILAGAGQLGSGSIGRGGENVSVNAATGGLVISRRDEFLTGVGPDAAVSRSYNSLVHTGDRDNGDQWQQSTTRRIFAIYGDENTVGSTAQRLGADGSVINYEYSERDGELAYWAIDGAGTHDRLDFDGTRWTWTDGDSLTREIYNAAVDAMGEYRLTELVDVSGQRLTYSYQAGSDRLDRITTQNGEWIEYKWDLARGHITQIDTGYLDQENGDTPEVLTRVYYEYETGGAYRLSRVITDLSPEDQSKTDQDVYSISYQYVDATSNLVSKISQSDGSELSIAYASDGRVETLTQLIKAADGSTPAQARTTSLAYHIGYTEITHPDATTTRMDYDAGGRLLQITTTPPQAGALSQIRQFEYDADGNVIRVIEGESDAPGSAGLGGGLDVDAIEGSGGAGASQPPITHSSTGRGSNLSADYVLPETASQAPADGTLPEGWGGWNTGETNWKVVDAPYSEAGSNDSLALNLTNLNGDAHSGRAEFGTPVTLDPTKHHEYTFYFQHNSDDDIRFIVKAEPYAKDADGNTVPTFKNAQNGRESIHSNIVDVRTNHASKPPVDQGKWYKAVVYILADGTPLLDGGKRGGIYDIETGAKFSDVTPMIWSDNRVSDTASLRFRIGGLTGTDPLKGLKLWRPEIREVEESAILKNDDLLDVATDAELLALGQDTQTGGSSGQAGQPGENTPTGTITGAPSIAYDNMSRETRFTYDEDGNVISTTDANGRTIINEYDDNNNLVRSSELFSDLLSHPAEFLTGSYEGPPDAGIALSSAWDIVDGVATQSTNGFEWSTLASREVLTGQVGKTYTVSAEVRIDNAVYNADEWSPFGLGFMTLDENFVGVLNKSNWPSPEFTSSELLDNGWVRFSYSYKANENDKYLRARFYKRDALSGDGTISIRNFSLSSGNDENTLARNWDRFADITSKPVDTLTHGAEGAPDEVGGVGSYWTFQNGVASKDTATNVWGGIGTRELIKAEAGKTYKVYADVKIDGATYDSTKGPPLNLAFMTHDENFDQVTHQGSWSNTPPVLNNGWVRIEFTYTATAADKFLRPHFYQRDALGGDGTLSIRNFHAEPAHDVAIGRELEQTRYVYDSENHLRYRINGGGEVTEYRYNSDGTLQYTITYPENTYTISSARPSLSELDNWRSGIADRSSTQIIRNNYDPRGNLIQTVRYTSDSDGTVRWGSEGGETIATNFLYDQAGRLLQTSDGHEQAETFIYDGMGRVIASTDGAGETTNFVFEDAQTRTVISNTLGAVTTNTYNTAGELISQTTSGSYDHTGTSSYKYDKMGRLRMETDETGYKTYYLYDKLGRKVADVNHYGHLTEYRYDTVGRVVASASYAYGVSSANLTTLANPDSTLEISDIRPGSHSYDVWSWSVYDAKGRLVQSVDGTGGVSRFDYDHAGRLVKTTNYYNKISSEQVNGFKNAAPTSIVLPSAHSKDAASRVFYDRAGRLVGSLDGEGYLTETRYDEAGQKVEEIAYAKRTNSAHWSSGTFGELRASAAPHSAANRHMHYVYNGLGLLRFQIDQEGRATGFKYNNAGKVTETIVYAAPINTSDTTFDSVNAKIAAVANSANDRKSTNVYNNRGQVSYSTDPAGLRTTYTYDVRGQVAKTVVGTDANARTTRHWYTSQGDLRWTVDAEGYVKRYDYDNEHRLTREVTWSNKVTPNDSTNLGQIHAATGSAGSWTDVRYTYDAAGRRNSMYDGEGNRTLWTWHRTGLLGDEYLGYTDSSGATTDSTRTYHVFDGSGRLARVTHAHGTSEATNSYTYYDGLGNVSRVVDPNGKTTTYTYDKRGLVLTETNAEGGVTHYEYNAFGEVVKATDPRGNSSYTYYDNLGRVTKTRDAENYVTETTYTAFGEIKDVTTRYNRTTSAVSTTTPPSVTTNSRDATTRFEYDKRGLVTKTTDAEGHFQTFTYDIYGNRITSRAKSSTTSKVAGGTTTYTYDKRGLMVSETMPATALNASGAAIAITNNYVYDSRGNQVSMTEGVGLEEARTTTYIYDDANRLIETQGQAREVYEQNTHRLLDAGYVPKEFIAYDARGNVTRTIDASGAKTFFFYDDLNRKVVEIDALGTYTAYEYDSNSNVSRIRIFEEQVNLGAINHEGGAQEQAPDAPSGNARETRFEYDALNRLTVSSVILPSGYKTGEANSAGTAWTNETTATLETRYEYDANGNVVKTTDPAGNETYAYYDKLGRKTSQVDGERYRTDWTYNEEGNVLLERQFASRTAIPTSTTVPPTVNWDSSVDRRTDFWYDKNGRRIKERRFDVLVHNGSGSTTSVTAEVSYLYNGLGQVTQKTEATGDSITYVYDDGGRLEYEERSSFIGHTGVSVTPRVDYAYDGLGNLTQSVAAGAVGVADRITRYEYNDGGLLSRMNDAAGNVREYFYDKSGRQIVEEYSRSGQTEASLTKFDLLGRVTEQKQARWDGPTNSWDINSNSGADDGLISQTEYNAFGDVLRTGVNGLWQTENKFDLAGRLWATNAGDGVWKFFGYDKNGNQTLAIASAGEIFTDSTDFQTAFAGVEGDDDKNGIADTDVNATYTLYDARNMAIEVIEEGRELAAGDIRDLITSRAYNAFGEVISETDARGSTLSYTYNTMGRMIRSMGATVQKTDEDGSTYWIRPTEDYYYDASGRLVAQRDADGDYATNGTPSGGRGKTPHTGNLTKLTLLAGTGYNGSEALVTQTIAEDGGIMRTAFDVHGDAREMIDQIDRVTTKAYDRLGRVTEISHAGGLVETMGYDSLGQVITRGNNHYQPTNQQTTEYDLQGRVVSTRAFGGDVTDMDYRWNAAINGIGLNTFGGWVQTTAYENTRTLVRHIDIYDRETRKTDLSDQDTSYTYDVAGRLTGLTARTTSINYNYYNTGLVKTHIKSDSVVSTQTVLETRFGYNETGDLVSEKLSRTTDQGPLTYNYTHPTDLARNGDPLLFKLFDDSGLDQNGDPITLVGFQVYNAAGEAIAANAGSVSVTQSGDNYLQITPNGNLGLVRVEYTLQDDRNQTAIGSITVSVATTPPVARDYGVIRTDTGSYIDINATDLAQDADGGPQPLKFVRSSVGFPPEAGIEIEWLNNDQTMRVRGVTPTTTTLPSDPFDDPFDDPNLDDFVPFLSWTITDGAANVSGQTLVEVSQGAIGQNDTANLGYRGTALINVLANDTVADGRTKTLTSVSSSNSSALEARIENNRLRLTHTSGAAGSYTVNYSFSDGVATRTATVSVTVAQNQPPFAPSSSVNLNFQASTSRQVIFGNDAEGHTVSIDNVTVLNGRGSELSASASGNSIAINHQSGNGSYTIRYQLRDQFGALSAYGHITVNVANSPPVEKSYGIIQTDTDAYVDIHVSDLASDPDGAPEPLKFVRSMLGFPSDAGVQVEWLNGDRTMRVRGIFKTPALVMIRDYPEPEWEPYHAFISWGVTDGASQTAGQTEVRVSQGAVAEPDSATLNYRGTKLVDVLDNDLVSGGRQKTLTAVSSNSSALGVQIENNRVRLTHSSGSAGNYTVTYSFTDGVSTQTSTVAVTVRANRAPTANDYSVTLGRQASTSRQVIFHNDPDGHSVSITNISVLNGRGAEFSASVDSNDARKIRLTHVSGHGTYEVRYRIKDQYNAYSDYKTITVTVAAPSNRNPIISNTNITANRSNLIPGGVYSFGLAQYLTDPDGDTVRIKPGSVSTPNPSFFGASGTGTTINFWAWSGSGSAVVSYTVEDQKGGEASGQITFNFTVAQTGGVNQSAPSGGSVLSATSLDPGSISAASAQSSTPAIIDVSNGTPTNGAGSGPGAIDVDWGISGVNGITGGNYTPDTGVLRDSTATYDALGRLKTWNEAGGVNTPAASKELYYDANSNIRRSVSNFAVLNPHGDESGTRRTDYWFTYDKLNRVIVDKGIQSGNDVTIGNSQGTRFEWDAAGQRKHAIYNQSRTVTFSGSEIGDILGGPPPPGADTYTWVQETKETYTYNDAGQVERITLREDDPTPLYYDQINGWGVDLNPETRTLSEMQYNLLGQQTLQEDFARSSSTNAVFSQSTSYNASNGRVTQTITDTTRDGDDQRAVTTYYYGSFGSHVLNARDVPTGNVTGTRTTTSGDDFPTKTSETINSYTFYDNAVQNGIRHTDNISNSNKITTTGFVLDGGGNTLRAVISDARSRTVNYTHDISGQVIGRREADNLSSGDPRDIYYRFGGKEMGHITNNGGDYHQNYEQSVIGRTSTPGDPSEGAFYNGSAIGTARGNFDYSVSRFTSYNQDSGAGTYTVRSGENLAQIAAQQYGDSNLWYRIAQANGLSSAQAPLSEGQILRLPAGVSRSTYNASTFQPYDPATALGDVNPGAPTPPKAKGKCGVFGQILLVVVAVAVTAVLSPVGTATFGQAVLAAAGGSLASQGVGLATGIQKKFSFKGLALSAISAGVTSGIAPEGFLGGDNGLFGKGLGGAVARGATASAITQGIGVATGLQNKFSFAGVAAAGVAAGVGNLLGGELAPLSGDGAQRTLRNIASHIGVGAARSIASAATRSAIEGSSFSRALAAGLPDVIGQVVGQAIGGAVDGGRRELPIAALASGGSPIRIPEISLDPVTLNVATDGELVSAAQLEGAALRSAVTALPAAERALVESRITSGSRGSSATRSRVFVNGVDGQISGGFADPTVTLSGTIGRLFIEDVDPGALAQFLLQENDGGPLIRDGDLGRDQTIDKIAGETVGNPLQLAVVASELYATGNDQLVSIARGLDTVADQRFAEGAATREFADQQVLEIVRAGVAPLDPIIAGIEIAGGDRSTRNVVAVGGSVAGPVIGPIVKFAGRGSARILTSVPISKFLVGGQSFASFPALKRAIGPIPKGFEVHHIVEQNRTGQFGVAAIQNTKNVVIIPRDIHKKITGFFNSGSRASNTAIRSSLDGKSFDTQFQFGLNVLERNGIDVSKYR